MRIHSLNFKIAISAVLAVFSAVCVAQNSSSTAAQREAEEQAQLAAQRPIAAGSSYWLEELTSLEIRDLIASGTTTVIIATGGVEENGPYLATGKHNLILEGVCPALAEKLGNALCAPLVKFVPEGNINPPTGAMRYPGTISLSASTYEALLTDISSSLKQSGGIAPWCELGGFQNSYSLCQRIL
jgi:hypothetical protein